MHTRRLFLVALLPFTACRSNATREERASAVRPPPSVATPEVAAPAKSAPAPHEPKHDHGDHGHHGDHAHEDPDSFHAKLHRPPDPNAPPLAIPLGHTKVSAKPVAPVPTSPDDPLRGQFTLADATKGLPSRGRLVAEIRTTLGALRCELYEDRAPLTVANFVGLARGRRPFKNAAGAWVKKPAYDGTTFYRIERALMLHAGDPTGTGQAEPGYVIPDEIWEDAYHYESGLLCMEGPANRNGMRFFVLNGAAPQLDQSATIFGKCGPDDVVDRIALVDVNGDRPVKPPKIERVIIRRLPGKP